MFESINVITFFNEIEIYGDENESKMLTVEKYIC